MKRRDKNIKPSALVLFLTKRCNSRCPHCFWVLRDTDFFYTSDDMDMPIEKAKEVVDAYYDLGVRNIKLQSEGEVLQYKYLEELTLYCRKKGYHSFGLATNGIELDRYIDYILNNIEYIAISLDGYNAETYIKHRGGTEATFNRIINGIRMLVEERNKRKLKNFEIHITSVLHDKNWVTAKHIVELVESLGVDRIKFSNFHPVGGEKKLKPISTKHLQAMRSLFSKRSNKVKIRVPRTTCCQSPFYCAMLFRTALVGLGYNMAPCCRINTDPQWGVFTIEGDSHNSPKLRLFRKKFIRAKTVDDLPLPCRKCGRRA